MGTAKRPRFASHAAHRARTHRCGPMQQGWPNGSHGGRGLSHHVAKLPGMHPTTEATAHVVAVHSSGAHTFSKTPQPAVTLLAGLGVSGDAHAGTTVRHRSRVAKDPTQPNLRQVHLLHAELLAELGSQGLPVQPGQMGENITTTGLPLLDLPEGTVLRIGPEALVRITGLRNPCPQIEAFMPGLQAAVLGRTPDGVLVRKAGVMGVVLAGGTVRAGDAICIEHRPDPATPLRPV